MEAIRVQLYRVLVALKLGYRFSYAGMIDSAIQGC
jgi:hypothetical protein